MRDDELHDQLAAWVRPLETMKPPNIAGIRRRARRRAILRNAAFAAVTVAVLAGAGVVIGSTARAPSPAPKGAPEASRPSAVPQLSAAPSHGAVNALPSHNAPPRSRRPLIPALCDSNDLQISAPASPVGAGMSGITDEIVFRNTGPATCSLEGWPHVTVLDAHGRQVRVTVVDGTANGEWSVTATRVILRPAGQAAAWALFGGASGCTTSWAWVITPPGGTKRTVVHEASRADADAPCADGTTIELSAVHPAYIPPSGSYPPTTTPAGVVTTAP